MIALLLSMAVLGSPEKGGPDPSPGPGGDEVIAITIYDDDPMRGIETCRREIIDWAPAVCHVEPESAAPDVTKPGWALQFGPAWSKVR